MEKELEIRIPIDANKQWDALVNEMRSQNIKVDVSDYKHIRNNTIVSIQATLKPYDTTNAKYRTYAKFISKKGNEYYQKANGICYHGHYEFLRQLFNRIPLATVQSSLIKRVADVTNTTWMNADNFDEIADAIASINVGSIIEPVLYAEKCMRSPKSACCE